MHSAGGGETIELKSFSQSEVLAIAYPSDIAVGDILFFVSAASGANRVNEGLPSGFTQVNTAGSGANTLYFGYRLADGTESGTVDGRNSNDNIYQYMLNFSGPVTGLLDAGDASFGSSENPVDTAGYGSPSLMFNAELNDLGAGSVGFVSGTDGSVTTLTNLAVGFSYFSSTPSSVEALSALGGTSTARSGFAALHTIV
jgi:hypothetical protein